MAGYGGHDGRASTEEAGGSATAVGEVTTGTEGETVREVLSLAGKLHLSLIHI